MKTIVLYQREVYGKPLFYIEDTATAAMFRELTGTKTITERQMQLLRDLTGAKFAQSHPRILDEDGMLTGDKFDPQ